MTDPGEVPPFPAAARWRELLEAWTIPDRILDRAPESPWFHDPGRFAVDATLDRDITSARWAREVLPPIGGTVADVGCGGGRAALRLVPPASELIGIDRNETMLERFVAAAASVGVARRTVHGPWPHVAPQTPATDVVVCHHVVYDVADIVPFVTALTLRARLAVVVELSTVHPMSAWSPAWRYFWDLDRPDGPTADDFVAVLRELGIDPEVSVGPRSMRSSASADVPALVATARRRLCLTAARDDELRAWLAEHPPQFVDRVATVRWPGGADHDL